MSQSDMQFAEVRYLSDLLSNPLNEIYKNKIISITIEHCLSKDYVSIFSLREIIDVDNPESNNQSNLSELKGAATLDAIIGGNDRDIIEKIPLNHSLTIKIKIEEGIIYVVNEVKLLQMNSCSQDVRPENILIENANQYYDSKINEFIGSFKMHVAQYTSYVLSSTNITEINNKYEVLFNYIDKVVELIFIDEGKKQVLQKIKERTRKFIDALNSGYQISGRVDYCKLVLNEIMGYLKGVCYSILISPTRWPPEDLDEILSKIKTREGAWLGGSRETMKRTSNHSRKTKKDRRILVK
uniref:Uncharacterized protein n=1 Tax=viral metagenome TaxID=1070528 RepID=A0A6C0D310_9ZZZZ